MSTSRGKMGTPPINKTSSPTKILLMWKLVITKIIITALARQFWLQEIDNTDDEIPCFHALDGEQQRWFRSLPWNQQ